MDDQHLFDPNPDDPYEPILLSSGDPSRSDEGHRSAGHLFVDYNWEPQNHERIQRQELPQYDAPRRVNDQGYDISTSSQVFQRRGHRSNSRQGRRLLHYPVAGFYSGHQGDANLANSDQWYDNRQLHYPAARPELPYHSYDYPTNSHPAYDNGRWHYPAAHPEVPYYSYDYPTNSHPAYDNGRWHYTIARPEVPYHSYDYPTSSHAAYDNGRWHYTTPRPEWSYRSYDYSTSSQAAYDNGRWHYTTPRPEWSYRSYDYPTSSQAAYDNGRWHYTIARPELKPLKTLNPHEHITDNEISEEINEVVDNAINEVVQVLNEGVEASENDKSEEKESETASRKRPTLEMDMPSEKRAKNLPPQQPGESQHPNHEGVRMFPNDNSLQSFLNWKDSLASADDLQLEENKRIMSTLINQILDDRSGAYKELTDLPISIRNRKTYLTLIREFMKAKFGILRRKRCEGDFPWTYFEYYVRVENWPHTTFCNPSIFTITNQFIDALLNVKMSRKAAFPDDRSLQVYLAQKKNSDLEENQEILRRLMGRGLELNWLIPKKDLRSILIEDFLVAKYSILQKKTCDQIQQFNTISLYD